MNTKPLFKKQTALCFLPLLLLLSLFSCSLPGSLDFNRNFYSGLSLTIPRYAPWIQEAGKNRALGFTDKVELLVKNDKKEIVFEETYRGRESHSEGILLNVPLPVGENYTLEISLFNYQVSQKHPTLRGTSSPFSIKAGAATPLTLYCTPVEPQILDLSQIGGGAELSFFLMSTLMNAGGSPLKRGGEKWFHLKISEGEENFLKPGFTVSSQADVYFCLFNEDGRPAGTRFRGWENIFDSLKPGQEYYLGVFAGSREAQKEVEVHIQFPKDKKSININSNGAHGDESVTASPDTAAQGTMVTLSAQLETGRKVELSADGITFSVDSIETNAGTATFTMPDKDVNIKAAFSYIVPPAKEITSFVFEKAKNSFLTNDVTATIDEVNHKITAVVPYGIDLSSEDLIPTITLSSGATVSLASGVPANGVPLRFDSPVTYTVTAEDGTTTQTYTVEVSAALNSAAAITGFVFGTAQNSVLISDVTAAIDEVNHKITATVSYGIDLSAQNLTPIITLSSGATVSPASGAAQDFSTSSNYTVTAEDGTIQTYTVVVSAAPNSAAAITGFVFETAQNSVLTSDVTATIDEGNHRITATVPYGIDLSAQDLTPIITLSSGATVSPASGAAQDFSTSSNYTVTAEDGTIQTYTVVVSAAPNSAAAITGFVFETAQNSVLTSDVTAAIDEVNHKITATVPYGTDLSTENLTPTITLSSGAAVSPANGASQRFYTPVTYTVTAEDGTTTQAYTVEVSAALNSAVAITGFVFETAQNSFLTSDVTAAIDEVNHKITATVPYGTDLSTENLTPTITLSSGATVSLASGAPANGVPLRFDSSVNYIVTAQDGTSTQEYLVNVSAALNSAAAITGFVFETAQNSLLTSDVTATIDEVNHKITATVSYGTDLSTENLTPTITLSSGATVSPSSGASQRFYTPVTYTVTAEDGTTTQTYTVEVSAALNSAAAITGFVFGTAQNSVFTSDVTATIDEGNHKITATVPYGTDLSTENLIPTITLSSGATVSPANGASQSFYTPVTYTVTAEDGTTTQTYTVEVSAALNSAAAITGFVFETAQNSLLTSDVTAQINEVMHKITVTMPYGTDLSVLSPTITLSTGATVSPVSGAAQDFSTSLVYTVTAEDGSTQSYLVSVSVPVAVESGFSGTAIKDKGTLSLTDSGQSLTMVYANDSASRTFPTVVDDSGTQTLSTKFWMAETETTNAVAAAVLQWAKDNNRIVETSGAHNEVNSTTVKYGGQELLNLDGQYSGESCRIDYTSGSFSVESGYGDYPVIYISWYGAVMLCNWLTEMRDGNADNLVYSGMDNDWDHTETAEDRSKTGYRLPGEWEWEYAARYRGSDSTNTVSGYSDPYYTKGDSASGATGDFNDASANDAVAWYKINAGNKVHPVKEKTANTLDLYDMSGNVKELCYGLYSPGSSNRVDCGGSWFNDSDFLRVGFRHGSSPSGRISLGFRLCRTAD